jgi:glutamate formiminotransferase/glutamate formiminotransferase/formiminotetrahydrofolate cyclodeaminase
MPAPAGRDTSTMLECVVNVSEGRDGAVIEAIAASAGRSLLDLHRDVWHQRSVLTLAGPDVEDAVRTVAETTVRLVDIREHVGAHPRFGALDVVPFVPLDSTGAPVGVDAPLDHATRARARFARWAADTLALPCFFYGPERTLPDVRRQAFVALVPDTGPAEAHPTAGACAVGARPGLIAYNLWLTTSDVGIARAIAAAVRGPSVRALGLRLGDVTQVSCNLVDPVALGPAELYDAVRSLADDAGTALARAELVGLVPGAVLGAVDVERWSELDLAPDRTVEARLSASLER